MIVPAFANRTDAELRDVILRSLSQKDTELAVIALVYRLVSGGTVGTISYGRWYDHTGTVNSSNEIVLSPGELPARDEEIIVTVENNCYNKVTGSPTYTVNRATNKITFSNAFLNGLNYCVKIWR